MIAFGPVPSRRLGQGLAINNIPPKLRTYCCLYCQLGRTKRMEAQRQAFYDPHQIFAEVSRSLEKVTRAGERVDYLTFVPDGEPTLDINLGRKVPSRTRSTASTRS